MFYFDFKPLFRYLYTEMGEVLFLIFYYKSKTTFVHVHMRFYFNTLVTGKEAMFCNSNFSSVVDF